MVSVKSQRVFYMVTNAKNANMPRKLYRKIKKTYVFSPEYKRDSYIQYQKTVPILKVIDKQIINYIKEMGQVFDNLMELSLVEIEECLTIPENEVKNRLSTGAKKKR